MEAQGTSFLAASSWAVHGIEGLATEGTATRAHQIHMPDSRLEAGSHDLFHVAPAQVRGPLSSQPRAWLLLTVVAGCTASEGPTSTPTVAQVEVAEEVASTTDPLAEAIRAYAATRTCASQQSCWINPQPDGETRYAVGGTGERDLWFAGSGDALHFDGATVRAHATHLAPTFALWSSGADAMWAAGGGGVARWNGAAFVLDRVSPGQEFRSVWGSRDNDVYAVGQHELVHWDGRSWTVVPGVTGTQVAGSAPDDVWVGGLDLWHFDGRAWSRVHGGPARPVVMLSVLGRDDVWAAGRSDGDDLQHFDGQSWSASEAGERQLFSRGVAAHGSRGRWLLGNKYSGSTLAYFDGSSWTRVPGPALLFAMRTVGERTYAVGASGRILRLEAGAPPRFDDLAIGSTKALHDTWGTSPTDMWAVGESGAALHYDGKQVEETKTGTTWTLHAVSGTSRDDAWTVGTSGTILHWDGKVWKRIEARTIQAMHAVFAATPGTAWTVSSFELLRVSSDGRSERFLLGGAPPNTYTHDLHGTAADDVWVVGYFNRDATSVGFVSHFDGVAWSPMHELRNGVFDRRPTRIHARARDDVWVATAAGPSAADDYVWHWNGKDWTALWLQPSADKPAAADARPLNPPRFDEFQLGTERWTIGANGAWRRWLR